MLADIPITGEQCFVAIVALLTIVGIRGQYDHLRRLKGARAELRTINERLWRHCEGGTATELLDRHNPERK
jgi:hypothetical protein